MKIRNYRFIQYISVLFFFGLVSCEKDDIEPVKTRTLMVYLAGDNNLSGSMQTNINDMMSAWKESYNANIVVYFDAQWEAPELFTFHVKGKKVEKQVIKTYDEMNSASVETLQMVLNEMRELYPSESYGLILGSHGTGWIPARGGRANRSIMQETRLTRAFLEEGGVYVDTRALAKALPSGLEFILFDACFMSSVEVLYDLKDKAKYVIASAAELPIGGFPYKEVMPYFWGRGEKLENGLKTACEKFIEHYNNLGASYFGTIALVKMESFDRLFDLTREVLQGKADEVANMSRTNVYLYPNVEYYGRYVFFDLGDYMRYVTEEDGRTDLYKEYRDLLDKEIVKYKGATEFFNNKTIPEDKNSGISTYIPLDIWPDETNAYWGFDWSKVYDAG